MDTEDTAPTPEVTEPVATPEVPTAEVEEALTTDEPTPEPKADKLSKKFEVLTRKERDIRRKEQELKQVEQKAQAIEQAVANAKQNPMAVLKELGISYQDLTTFLLNDEQPPEPDPVQKELEDIKAWKAQQEQLAAQQAQAQVEQAVNEFYAEINDLVSKDDRFELTRHFGYQQTVFDVISEHYQKYEEILPIEEAAKAVEQHLEQETSTRLGKSTKVRKLFETSTEETPDEPTDATTPVPTASKKTGPKTLTNKQASTQPSRPTDKKRSDEERRLAALRILENAK